MKKYLVITLITLLAIGSGIAITYQARSTTSESETQKLDVGVSYYILEELAQQIGKEHVTVTSIVKPGIEIHDFEPTARDTAALYDTSLFLYHGAGLDAWAEKLAPQLAEQNIQTVEVTKTMTLRDTSEALHIGHEEDSEEEHEEGPKDPHTWLDPILLQQEVAIVRDAFIAADPAHAAEYRSNADAYIKTLEELDAEYRTTLTQCATPEIIVAHDAFSYLGARYGITVHSIAGISSESEPSASHLADLATLAKEKNIRTIFFETLTSPKLSQAIAQEVGAQSTVLNPIEGLTPEQKDTGTTYADIMRENLQNLSAAMSCAN